MTKRKSFRTLVLEMEPQAKLDGPYRAGHYVNYVVRDGAGVQIGWTEGNEQGTLDAWMRAYSTLMRRKPAEK